MNDETQLEPQTGGVSAAVPGYASGWRLEPPDRPGWWWFQWRLGGEPVLKQVVLFSKGKLGTHTEPLAEFDGVWAGPVLPPLPPADSHKQPVIVSAAGIVLKVCGTSTLETLAEL